MPQEVEEPGDGQAYPKFNVPFKDSFNYRDIPFIVDLQREEQPCKRCEDESRCQNYVPEFSVDLLGIEIVPVKKVTEQIE